jgi:uncharacterized protein (DUF362 family)
MLNSGNNSGLVSVRRGDDGYTLARESLATLDFDIGSLQGKRVLIKPNAGRLVSPYLGINTNPVVVAGVIDAFLEAGVSDLFVGESPILGVKALEALDECGMAEVARKRNVPLVDLDAKRPVVVKVPEWKAIDKLKVCREVLNVDFIVSIPVMKTHMHTQVSLGLKNMKGCLYKREKVKLHQLPSSDNIVSPAKPLDVAIADLSKVLLPDLTVIDGTIGQEGLGPSAGQPKEFGVVVSSRNCLAADWVAVELMGLDPVKVHHLRLAIDELNEHKEDFNFDRSKLKVFPENYKEWAVTFQTPPEKISFEFEHVAVEDANSCSACLSTVLMFLKRYHDGFADYFSETEPLRIALGKAIGDQPEKTLLIGNCTAHQKKGCIFIKGCPPVASQIFQAMQKHWDLE